MERKELNSKLRIPLLEEVENQLRKLLRQRREEIERELEEKIRREKEEAEKKIKLVEQEYEKGTELLADYHQVLADFEAERLRLQEEVKARIDQIIIYQTEIERLASLTLEEIKKVDELNKELQILEKKSEEKIAIIRQQIEEKYGLVTEVPEIPAEAEFKVDLEKELKRLKKIKELLSGEVVPEKKEEKGSELFEVVEVTEATEVKVEGEVLEEIIEAQESQFPKLDTLPENGPESKPVVEPSEQEEFQSFEPETERIVETFKSVYEKLEGFRRGRSEGNGEVIYFEKNGRMIIDAESVIAAMNEALEASRKLYQKLSLTDSPKDHFFIKQEIINQQEILRKHLLNVTKLCEKEGYTLPRFSQGLLNVNLLRNLLERLSIENWSDDSDFQSISEFIENLKEDFYRLMTPPVTYLKALLDELGAA